MPRPLVGLKRCQGHNRGPSRPGQGVGEVAIPEASVGRKLMQRCLSSIPSRMYFLILHTSLPNIAKYDAVTPTSAAELVSSNQTTSVSHLDIVVVNAEIIKPLQTCRQFVS